ncbi:MAG TPA: hypothetical protein VHT34_13085 [Clostridia bacterium]|nr:hypothetical protein [Clostridia bacterium]
MPILGDKGLSGMVKRFLDLVLIGGYRNLHYFAFGFKMVFTYYV